jgi:hypothetical protein
VSNRKKGRKKEKWGYFDLCGKENLFRSFHNDAEYDARLVGYYAVLTGQYRRSNGGNAFICRVQQSKKTDPQDGSTTWQAITYNTDLMLNNNYYFILRNIEGRILQSHNNIKVATSTPFLRSCNDVTQIPLNGFFLL